MRPVLFIAMLSWSACTAFPARFADAPPATAARDALPSPVPRHEEPGQTEYLAEVYMRRPVMDALEVTRFPRAGDVNSRDEVVHSSWFAPDPRRQESLEGYAADGPPRAPWRVTSVQGRAASIIDARGLAYVLRRDDEAWPEMKSAADAISSRLLWAMGYITAEVHVIQATMVSFQAGDRTSARTWLGGDHARASATRWPVGIELGPAPPGLTRQDDPNDRLEHRDRRTLRSLQAIGAWLDLRTIGPHKTPDVYIGEPGCGHVVHYLAGFEDSLGTTRVAADVPLGSPHPDCGPNPTLNFLTLGLAPDPGAAATQERLRGLGVFPEHVRPERYRPDLPPYEPLDRMQPEDGYWAARTMMRIQPSVMRAAVDAGALTEPRARARLVAALESRRRLVASYWAQQVTPLQLEGVSGWSVRVRDDAVAWGLAAEEMTAYRLELLDERGEALGSPSRMRPGSPCFAFELPEQARGQYVIVRIRAVRGPAELPRPVEFHLWGGPQGARLAGILH